MEVQANYRLSSTPATATLDRSAFSQLLSRLLWGFPKIRGTILGVPIRRTIVFWGLYWGPPYFEKVPYCAGPAGGFNARSFVALSRLWPEWARWKYLPILNGRV